MFGLSGTNPVMVDIDTPSPGGILSGSLALNGWAVGGNAPISSVTLSLDGTVIGQASYGSSRPDVQSAFPGNPGGSSVGWTSSLNTNNLSNGNHSLMAVAVDGTGAQNSTTQNFIVANSGASSAVLTPIPTLIVSTPTTPTLFSSGSPSPAPTTPTAVITTSNGITPVAVSSPSISPLLLIGGGALLLLLLLGGSKND